MLHDSYNGFWVPNIHIVYIFQRNWIYSDGYYLFSGDVDEMSVDEEMPYVNVAKKMLQYAREMEMIIWIILFSIRLNNPFFFCKRLIWI